MTPPRPVGRPPRLIKRIKVSTRFEPSELAEIDAARSDTTRQDWIYGITLAHARRVNKARGT